VEDLNEDPCIYIYIFFFFSVVVVSDTGIAMVMGRKLDGRMLPQR
jgi:hypothetical protein